MEPSAQIKTQSVLIDNLAPTYLKFSMDRLEEAQLKEAIKGKFPNVKYKLDGYDVSGLNLDEKSALINSLFELNSNAYGLENSADNLERMAIQIKDRFGLTDQFVNSLKFLPEEVFKEEKVKSFSREELESKVLEYSRRVEVMKDEFDKRVTMRTLELEADKDMLEAILYNASDGVFALDRAGRIITFNKVMEELTGFAFDEIRHKNADEVIRLFEDSAPLTTNVYCPSVDLLDDKNIYTNGRVTMVARNGSKKYVKMTSAVISRGKQVDLSCIVTLTDITNEIELENMKLDFVSMAAHELRTPLTSIRGYLTLLSDDLQVNLSDQDKEYMERIIVSTDQLYILVENLLNISRIERGTLVLERHGEDLVPIVKSAMERFKESANNSQVSLNFVETRGEIPKVYIDKTMITEVLSNLLDNAIRYTPEGGRVTIFVEAQPDKVITHIKDTGIGIPQASIPHLFKKFYRVSGVLRQGAKGTGLGLFISKEIIKLHGGSIWVESTEGKGSTFSFSVPVNKN